MKALLVVAHGSRRAASNDEVRSLTRELRGRAGARFADVRCAFLELAEPSIPDGIGECVAQGAQDIIVLPYFLSAGRHVAHDIPDLLALAQARYPSATIRLAPYLGTADSLLDVMLGLAESQP